MYQKLVFAYESGNLRAIFMYELIIRKCMYLET